MSVVREQGPGVDGESPLLRQAGQAGYAVGVVGVIPEEDAPLLLSTARTRPRGSLGQRGDRMAPLRWGARGWPRAVPGEAAMGEPADASCIVGRILC